MSSVKTVLSLLLLLLWVPATGHCLLENVMAVETACAERADSSEPGGDCCTPNCQSLENGYLKSNPQPSVDLNVAVLASAVILLESPQTVLAAGEFITSAPPDLLPRWHFVRRAALPVRAPSFLS